jgi:hypothetical protein
MNLTLFIGTSSIEFALQNGKLSFFVPIKMHKIKFYRYVPRFLELKSNFFISFFVFYSL